MKWYSLDPIHQFVRRVETGSQIPVKLSVEVSFTYGYVTVSIVLLSTVHIQSFIKLAQCGPPTLNGAMLPYTSTTEGANVILLCQKIDHTTLINDSYTVLTCSKDGNWEPNPGNFCTIATDTVIIIIM